MGGREGGGRGGVVSNAGSGAFSVEGMGEFWVRGDPKQNVEEPGVSHSLESESNGTGKAMSSPSGEFGNAVRSHRRCLFCAGCGLSIEPLAGARLTNAQREVRFLKLLVLPHRPSPSPSPSSTIGFTKPCVSTTDFERPADSGISVCIF